MFNHSHPASAYPTPPPPPSSSSSLAGALGAMEPLPPPPPPSQPLHQPQQPQQKIHYPPEQSSQFFNNFVDQKARQLSAMQLPKSVPTTPHRPTVAATSESPDPLALKTTSMTPRKRKPVVEITSPFVKRHKEMFPSTPQRPHMAASTSVTPSSSYSPSSAVPRTPTTVSSSRSTSVSTTTSTGKRKAWTLDCIQVPSANYLTPTSARKSASSPSILSSKKVRIDESPDELGGYGTENDDMYFSSPSKGGDMYSPTKASGRRAGDRDDRGMYFLTAFLWSLLNFLQHLLKNWYSFCKTYSMRKIPSLRKLTAAIYQSRSFQPSLLIHRSLI